MDIIQPDVMWMGGLTEVSHCSVELSTSLTLFPHIQLLKMSAMASAYDIPVIPHGSGP